MAEFSRQKDLQSGHANRTCQLAFWPKYGQNDFLVKLLGQTIIHAIRKFWDSEAAPKRFGDSYDCEFNNIHSMFKIQWFLRQNSRDVLESSQWMIFLAKGLRPKLYGLLHTLLYKLLFVQRNSLQFSIWNINSDVHPRCPDPMASSDLNISIICICYLHS